MEIVLKVKHLLYIAIFVLVMVLLFSGFSFYKQLIRDNRELIEINEQLRNDIESIQHRNQKLEQSLLQSETQLRIYEDKFNKTLGKLNQIANDYQNEIKNPTHVSTDERYNFIRSEIRK
jgi:predicted PurR-regulated permease PerM